MECLYGAKPLLDLKPATGLDSVAKSFNENTHGLSRRSAQGKHTAGRVLNRTDGCF
jgi:hypothetical protein